MNKIGAYGALLVQKKKECDPCDVLSLNGGEVSVESVTRCWKSTYRKKSGRIDH
jgi:hypothetical protein